MSHRDSRLRSECFKRSLRQVQVFSESPPTNLEGFFWLCLMLMFSRLKFTHCTYFQFVVFLLELKCSCLVHSVISEISLDLEICLFSPWYPTQILRIVSQVKLKYLWHKWSSVSLWVDKNKCNYFPPLLVGDSDRPVGFRSVKAPSTKIASSVGKADKLPICDKCGSGIM